MPITHSPASPKASASIRPRVLRSPSPFVTYTTSVQPSWARTDKDELTTEQVVMVRGATTIPDLIAVIPLPFGPFLAELIRDVHSTATKAANVSRQVEALKDHQRNGTFPPYIAAIRAPLIQFSAEFDSAQRPSRTDQPSVIHGIESVAHTHRAAMLTLVVSAKADEHAFLKGLLDRNVWKPKWEKICQATWDKMALVYTGPTEEVQKEKPVSYAVREYKYTLGMAGEICNRAINIARETVMADLLKRMRAMEVKDNADVEMRDVTTPNGAALATVLSELKALRKKVDAVGKSSSHKKQVSTPSEMMLLGHTLTSTAKEDIHSEARQRQRSRREIDGEKRWKIEGAPSTGQGKEESSGLKVFGYAHPSSYPDFTNVTMENASANVLLNAPIDLITSCSRFGGRLHLGPGVSMTANLQHQISVGKRFLLYPKFNQELVSLAWERVSNSLRWRYFFAVREEGNDEYDPDFKLHNWSPNLDAPIGCEPLELAIEEGRRVLCEQIPTNAPRVPKVGRIETPDMDKVHNLLLNNGWLVKNTDKNLGLAVVSLDWYRTEAAAHLNSSVYTKLTEEQATSKMFSIRMKVRSLVPQLKGIPEATAQMVKYMTSRTEDGEWHFPRFHGIPKIHKSPWKLRPIIPCHSTPTTPAGKILTKLLRPATSSLLNCIQSSAELGRRMAEVRLKPNEKYFLCTGDVKAMYTNIDRNLLETCVKALCNANNYAESTIDVIIELIRLCNDSLVTEYQGEYYAQDKGLAMGLAASPDLANIFCGVFENLRSKRDHNGHKRLYLKQVEDNDVILYVRYMDDTFAIIKASTGEEAIQKCRFIEEFPGLETVWSYSDTACVLLDMRIELINHELVWYPYAKAMNHYERLPWGSSHPKWVKKGCFLGELSRLASISSTPVRFETAATEYVGILTARGWPIRVSTAWKHRYADSIWARSQKALDTGSEDTCRPLILPTTYNPVWESVSARLIFDAMKPRLDLVLPNIRNRDAVFGNRMIISYNKGKSFGDFLDLWNKQILEIELTSRAENFGGRRTVTVKNVHRTDDDLFSHLEVRPYKRIRRF